MRDETEANKWYVIDQQILAISKEILSMSPFRYESDTPGTRGAKIDNCTAGVYFKHCSMLSIHWHCPKYYNQSEFG
jgi:hypothetical protein